MVRVMPLLNVRLMTGAGTRLGSLLEKGGFAVPKGPSEVSKLRNVRSLTATQPSQLSRQRAQLLFVGDGGADQLPWHVVTGGDLAHGFAGVEELP